MAETAKLIFQVEGADALKALNQISEKTKEVKTSTSGLSGVLDNAKKNWLSLTLAAGGMVTAFASVIKEAASAEKTENMLANALKNSGKYTKQRMDGVKAYASELSKLSVYSTGEIIDSQRMLVQYGLTGQALEDVQKAVLDLASAKGMDLNEATQNVGKSIATTNNVLGRYGITIKGAANETERASQIVSGINTMFGGSAQAAIQGFDGQWKQMTNSINDVKESLGAALLPAVTKMVSAFKGLMDWVNASPGRIEVFRIALMAIAGAFIAMKLAALGFMAASGLGILIAIAGYIILNWEKVKAYFNIFWAYIKIGFLKMSGIIMDAVYYSFYIWIQSMNAFIVAYNKITGKHIDTIGVIKDKLKASAKEQLAIEEEKLKGLKDLASREQEVRTSAIPGAGGGAGGESEGGGGEDLSAIYARQMESLMTYKDQVAAIELAADSSLYVQKLELLTEYLGATETMNTLALANKLQQQKQYDKAAELLERAKLKAEEARNSKRLQDFQTWASYMSGAQNSHVQAIWGVWKASAVAEATINTYKAATGAYAALSSIPFVGPILGVAAAGAAIAWGMEQVHNILATPPPRAETGGLVLGSPEGSTFTVGERSKSEAIIPLENPIAMDKLRGVMGNEIHLHLEVENLYGGSDVPVQTIEAIDRGFYRLLQDKRSMFGEALGE